jgi:Zn-dependent protease
MEQVTTWLSSVAPSLLAIILLIPSIVLHEVGHGFAAYKLGDPTAKNAGRLTLNPIKHLDPVGSVVLPLVFALAGGPIIGFAKPVPYNPRYFKNLKQGELIVGLAGPCVNLVLALIGSLVCLLGTLVYGMNVTAGYWIYYLALNFSYINLLLMFFNLLPIPPLDGFSIVSIFWPRDKMQVYYKVQQYALFILLGVIFIVPMLFHVDPLGWFLNATAGNLLNILVPW